MKIALLALSGATPLSTSLAATPGDFSYTSDGSSITITGYTGPGGAVTIPDNINGLPVSTIGISAFQYAGLTSVIIPISVTSIGVGAFEYCTSLSSVTIGNGVTSIGKYAFYYCHSLTSVTIPDSATSIGDEAFYYCHSLTNATLGNGVTSVGQAAFAGCASLTAILVRAGNSVFSSVDGVWFNKSQTTLIQYPSGKTGSTYTIPNSVTYIVYGAFYGCTSLTYITSPASVSYIGAYAFSFCTSLEGVFFKGNSPAFEATAFDNADKVVIYYLPGTTDWESSGGPPPTRLWNPLMQSSGVGPAGFGFNITGTTNIPIVVEAATSLANSTWVPLQSLNLTNGAFHFSDPNWANYPARFYRIRSP